VLGTDVEASVFDPANRYVLAPHLCAAAAEVPLTEDGLAQWFGATARGLVDELVRDGYLRQRPGGWFWTRPERASDLTDLRGSGGAPVRVVEHGTGRLLGTVDRAAAPSVVHRGAVYVHQGVTHVVVALDLDDAVATVIEEEVDYSTIARSISDIRVVDVADSQLWDDLEVFVGSVDVSAQVVSFQRRRPNGESL
jgi:DEAD/DEAH box helicase domain-containing protein